MVSKNMQRALSNQLYWRYVVLDEGHKVGWSLCIKYITDTFAILH